jgi:hypothetical protein
VNRRAYGDRKKSANACLVWLGVRALKLCSALYLDC